MSRRDPTRNQWDKPRCPTVPPVSRGTKGRVVHKNESTADQEPRTIQPGVPAKTHASSLGGWCLS